MTGQKDRVDGVHDLMLGDLQVRVRSVGAGESILLLHGFPHTGEVWGDVATKLVSSGFHVLTPDLRGIGRSGVTSAGYDAIDLAADQVRLLDELSITDAHVVGFDLGAAPAFALAASHPGRVGSLTLVEAVVGGLRGAEGFLASGAPWWFGFHQAPGGLAEDVVVGHEQRYVQYFLSLGSRHGVPEDMARRFVSAYTGRDRLRAAFDHYRAMPRNAAWNAAWAGRGRLDMPVSAVGASTVGDALGAQLAGVSNDVVAHLLPEAGHIVPVDAPDELAEIIVGTARRVRRPGQEPTHTTGSFQ